ncbi:hypothetical protein cypCar_00020953, partial [Cyprinus carpio]
IAEEEALLPVALFPKLSELVIHSNPLTTQRSGKLTLPQAGSFIDDEEDIDIGQEHFDLTSTDIFFETNQNAEPFFVTEINGLNESEYQEDPDVSKETELEKGCKACPEKLIGYEILLDDTPELEMPEFSGIQQAVSVLEHMLKNLLVYRDSKANLDLPQKPYTEREKKIKNLPPLGPKKSKGEKVEELLAQIKDVKTISKVPLDNVLEGGNGICKREYEEALTLLKDMKRKYRTAYLKRVEQAAQIETEMMYNLN